MVGRSQWDLREDLRGIISKILGGELQPTKNAMVAVRLYKEMFSKVEKG